MSLFVGEGEEVWLGFLKREALVEGDEDSLVFDSDFFKDRFAVDFRAVLVDGVTEGTADGGGGGGVRMVILLSAIKMPELSGQ